VPVTTRPSSAAGYLRPVAEFFTRTNNIFVDVCRKNSSSDTSLTELPVVCIVPRASFGFHVLT
jgi:hypothetical protein